MCCGLAGLFFVGAFLGLYVAFFGLLGLIVLPVAYFFRDVLLAAWTRLCPACRAASPRSASRNPAPTPDPSP